VIRLLEGNRSRTPIEPTGIEALGEPYISPHLCDDARGCIEAIVRSMPPGVYSALDSFTLAAFGAAWAVHKRATHELANPAFQHVVASKRGSQPNPWLRIANQQAQILASLGDRLGLNPAARAALKLPSAKQQKSKFEGLLGQMPAAPRASN
jgi:phage terminase small subunit